MQLPAAVQRASSADGGDGAYDGGRGQRWDSLIKAAVGEMERDACGTM